MFVMEPANSSACCCSSTDVGWCVTDGQRELRGGRATHCTHTHT
jgi:hypothetical protein